jgi:hypothetical protein
MLNKRFGHASVYCREKILVFGGFTHPDLPEEPPVTISACEVLSNDNSVWEAISPMNTSRSFFAAISINN